MNYKNTILTLLACLLASGSLIAQTTDTPKWEVGTDLLWLINKNTLPAYSWQIKRYHKPLAAWRLRIGSDFGSKEIRSSFDMDKANFMIRLGHEWGKNAGKNTVVFWGMEAHYQKDKIQDWLLPIPVTAPYYIPDYRLQIGGAAFIGFRYFVSSNLSLSIESAFKVFQRSYGLNTYSKGSIMLTPDNYELEAGKIKFVYVTALKSTILQLQPIQVFNISYHF